jgi:hypothetical protein
MPMVGRLFYTDFQLQWEDLTAKVIKLKSKLGNFSKTAGRRKAIANCSGCGNNLNRSEFRPYEIGKGWNLAISP